MHRNEVWFALDLRDSEFYDGDADDVGVVAADEDDNDVDQELFHFDGRHRQFADVAHHHDLRSVDHRLCDTADHYARIQHCRQHGCDPQQSHALA